MYGEIDGLCVVTLFAIDKFVKNIHEERVRKPRPAEYKQMLIWSLQGAYILLTENVKACKRDARSTRQRLSQS